MLAPRALGARWMSACIFSSSIGAIFGVQIVYQFPRLSSYFSYESVPLATSLSLPLYSPNWISLRFWPEKSSFSVQTRSESSFWSFILTSTQPAYLCVTFPVADILYVFNVDLVPVPSPLPNEPFKGLSSLLLPSLSPVAILSTLTFIELFLPL